MGVYDELMGKAKDTLKSAGTASSGEGTRELSKARLASIKSAKAKGSLGPFASNPQPDNDEKISPQNPRAPSNPTSFARQSAKSLQDRKSQKEALKGDY